MSMLFRSTEEIFSVFIALALVIKVIMAIVHGNCIFKTQNTITDVFQFTLMVTLVVSTMLLEMYVTQQNLSCSFSYSLEPLG